MWLGDLKYNSSAESLALTYGIGAKNLANEEIVCATTASFASVGAGPDACPDCNYSFTTEVTEGGNDGPYCEDWSGDNVFTYYAYTDWWFGNGFVDGWGWADSYTYSYSGTDYDLTSSVFMHYDNGTDPSAWYLRSYNFAANGSYPVSGDMNEASWESYLGGTPTYYYYFYY